MTDRPDMISTIATAMSESMSIGMALTAVGRAPMIIIMPSPLGRLPRATTYRAKLRRAKVRRKNRIAMRAFKPFRWAR